MLYLSRLITCVLFILYPFNLFANDNIHIAVVDIQRIEHESVAWQDKRAEIEAKFHDKREQILEQDKTLQKEVNDYQQQRPLLSLDRQQKRDQELNKKISALQKLASQQNNLLDERLAQANQMLRQQIALIIEKIAQEKKLDLILEISKENFSVVFFTERLDISDIAIKRLNKQYTQIITH